MTLLEQKLKHEPLARLVAEEGEVEACERLGVTLEQLHLDMAKILYRWDVGSFCEQQLKIINKSGDLVFLRLNGGQRKIAEAVETQQIASKPVRLALLKARQFGGSTLFEGFIYRDSVLRSNRSSMIIAHDLDSARHLREMSAKYYENYAMQKPRIKKESDKWWKFIHLKDGRTAPSHVRIDTAEELSTGHSLTLHNLHLSEIQNWRNAPVLVKGLFPTVPKNPDTMIFMEGTGSGVGDYWYDFCQMAMSGETEWKFVFVPWYEIEDYQQTFSSLDSRGDFEAKLDSEESALYHTGVSLEKLLWRREEIRGTYKGDIDAFRQQYPSNPDEAFLTSGRPVFNPNIIRKNVSESKKAAFLGDLIRVGGKVEFAETPKGIWELEELPTDADRKTQNLFVCGVDTSEGIAVVPELGNRGGDFSAVKVLRRDSRLMVGKLNQRLDPDLLADELHKAWEFWNCGILVESNAGGSGNVVIRALKDIPGINLLRRPVVGKKHDDQKDDEYGWKTMKDTKRIMIDELNEQIRENSFTDYDKDFWYQCSTYVRDEKGRTNAQSRKYDDLVMAGALAFQGDMLMPMVFRPSKDVKVVYARDVDHPSNRRNVFSQDEVMEQTLCEF